MEIEINKKFIKHCNISCHNFRSTTDIYFILRGIKKSHGINIPIKFFFDFIGLKGLNGYEMVEYCWNNDPSIRGQIIKSLMNIEEMRNIIGKKSN